MTFDLKKKEVDNVLPGQKTTESYGKSSSNSAQINAIAQQSASKEYRPYTGTIRKDRTSNKVIIR